jgi:flavin-binding protein dodecin
MTGSTYKIIEVVGTSDTSWEDAAKNAIQAADEHIRDLRVAEVTKLDLTVDKDGNITSYRARLDLSFKYYKMIKEIKTQERPKDLYSDI